MSFPSNNPRIILYSGGVHKEFGLDLLVLGFLEIQNIVKENWELHIYGDGNYVEELIKIAKEHSQIKYYGVVSNKLIVDKQVESDLLVNPRPTHMEFTKYSFPSKIFEYMSSGRPLITTILPGMPSEYFEHIYPIIDETISGFSEALLFIMNKSSSELYLKGEKAQKFILEHKSNIVQASRLVKFIQENFTL